MHVFLRDGDGGSVSDNEEASFGEDGLEVCCFQGLDQEGAVCCVCVCVCVCVKMCVKIEGG